MSSPSIQDFTPGLTISYLLMSQHGTPATAFNAGSAIDFSWESTGEYFQLFEGNNKTAVYAGSGSSTTFKSGVSVDTTFTLEANIGSNKLYKSVTAIIINPALTPSSMIITDNHTDKSDLTVMGNSTFNHQLDVNGKVKFPDPQIPNLEISGCLQTNCQINVAGDTIIGGTLNADSLNTGDTTVNKSLTALQGTVNLFNDSISVYNGNDEISKTFVAKCDGYFMAYVQADPAVWCKITLQLGSYSFRVSGGHIFNAYNQDVTSNSLLLPVSSGASLTYTTSYHPTPPTKAFTLQWYPIGKGAAQEATYEIIDTPADKAKAPVPDMAAILAASNAARMETATAFIQNLERACNKTIDATMKLLLTEKLLALK